MIFVPCEHGSDEWHATRAGVATASRFVDARSRLKRNAGGRVAGSWSDAALKYAWQIANERIAGKSLEYTFETYAMRRGTMVEPVARALYEARYGVLCDVEGVVLSDDRRLGYTTDGKISDENAGIEIKSLIATDKVGNIWMNPETAEAEYEDQILGGLLLTEWDYIDLVIFAPWLSPVNKDLFVKRIWRDDKKLAALEADLKLFLEMVDSYHTMLIDSDRPTQYETQKPDPFEAPAPNVGSSGTFIAVDEGKGDDATAVAITEIKDGNVEVKGFFVEAAGEAKLELNKVVKALSEPMPTGNIEVFSGPMPPPVDGAPSLTLGNIQARLGFPISQQFIHDKLGITAKRVKSSVLYKDSDWPAICDGLIYRLQGLRDAPWRR